MIEVTNTSSGNYHCLISDEVEARVSVDVGTKIAADTRAASAPWNIFDTALESFEYVSSNIDTPTEVLNIAWDQGYEWPITPGVSSYLMGVVRINGSLQNGDQWNDSVIAHEIGHWVMDKYSGFPDNYLAPHGDCSQGNMQMQYSESWANFFMAASRTQSNDIVNKEYAAYYIDAYDSGLNIRVYLDLTF